MECVYAGLVGAWGSGAQGKKAWEGVTGQPRMGQCEQTLKLQVSTPARPTSPRFHMQTPITASLRVSCSPLGEPYAAARYEGLLCPDPFSVCDTTDLVSQQLPQAALKDGAASHVRLASTTPVTETSVIISSQLTANSPGPPAPTHPHGPLPPAPSFLSPERFAPLDSLLSLMLWDESRVPESFLPLNPKFLPDLIPPDPLTSFPLVSKPSEVSTNVPTVKGTAYVSHLLTASSLHTPLAPTSLAYMFLKPPYRETQGPTF